jgi:hypothetical protein
MPGTFAHREGDIVDGIERTELSRDALQFEDGRTGLS